MPVGTIRHNHICYNSATLELLFKHNNFTHTVKGPSKFPRYSKEMMLMF